MPFGSSTAIISYADVATDKNGYGRRQEAAAIVKSLYASWRAAGKVENIYSAGGIDIYNLPQAIHAKDLRSPEQRLATVFRSYKKPARRYSASAKRGKKRRAPPTSP